MRTIAAWPRSVEVAAKANEPHRVAFFVYDLASEFASLYSRNKLDARYDMIHPDDPALTAAKIALARAVSVVIAAGLGILGVVPAEEMR